jgi:hypothetical protein
MSAARRTFLDARELPRLAWGAFAGRDVALRRILGARRGGRYGAALGVLALLLAVPAGELWLVLAVHGALTLATRPWLRLLDWRQQQRLLPWVAAPLLGVAALGRALGAPALPLALLALTVAHAMLAMHLRGWEAAPD